MKDQNNSPSHRRQFQLLLQPLQLSPAGGERSTGAAIVFFIQESTVFGQGMALDSPLMENQFVRPKLFASESWRPLGFWPGRGRIDLVLCHRLCGLQAQHQEDQGETVSNNGVHGQILHLTRQVPQPIMEHALQLGRSPTNRRSVPIAHNTSADGACMSQT
jgi:hypothetical protein